MSAADVRSRDLFADVTGRDLFHGGARGLYLGNLLLPPATTHVASTRDYGRAAAAVHRRDRVYATTEIEAARMFALLCRRGGGDLYRVEPVGPVEHDPDYLVKDGSLSVQAPKMRVLEVIERKVTTWQGLTAHQALRILTAKHISVVQP